MDVDSDSSFEFASSKRETTHAFKCRSSSPAIWREQCWSVVQEGIQRWGNELDAREEIIKKKAMVIRCQWRRINGLKRKLQETKDRLFMADEMQALVKDIGRMSLATDQPQPLE
jgi:hypothetical protein